MSEYPSISTGLGALTPDLWDRWMNVMRFVESLSGYESGGSGSDESEDLLGILADLKQSPKPFFLAKITGTSSEVTTNRYLYEFTEVELKGDTTVNGYETVVGGQEGTTALNLCEISNTSTNVGTGVDVHVATSEYPAGFAMMRIGICQDDTVLELVVMMFNVRDIEGQLRQVFFASNSHDGTCEA